MDFNNILTLSWSLYIVYKTKKKPKEDLLVLEEIEIFEIELIRVRVRDPNPNPNQYAIYKGFNP